MWIQFYFGVEDNVVVPQPLVLSRLRQILKLLKTQRRTTLRTPGLSHTHTHTAFSSKSAFSVWLADVKWCQSSPKLNFAIQVTCFHFEPNLYIVPSQAPWHHQWLGQRGSVSCCFCLQSSVHRTRPRTGQFILVHIQSNFIARVLHLFSSRSCGSNTWDVPEYVDQFRSKL